MNHNFKKGGTKEDDGDPRQTLFLRGTPTSKLGIGNGEVRRSAMSRDLRNYSTI
jgi:hypothetical protein